LRKAQKTHEPIVVQRAAAAKPSPPANAAAAGESPCEGESSESTEIRINLGLLDLFDRFR
jgi:hypothetical protein